MTVRIAFGTMALGVALSLVGCAGPGRMGSAPPNAGKCRGLAEGPTNNAPHGPLSNADLNRDGTVTRAELDSFMRDGEYRRVTLLAYFDKFDTDGDGKLSDSEFAKVDPPWSFNGTDANADCVVTRAEVVAYADEAGRSYRKIGLAAFFELVDTNHDNMASPAEIEAAHQSGLLARF